MSMSALPPSPFLFSSETSPDVKSPAADLLAPSPAAAGASNTVSPGDFLGSLPDNGESEPAVMSAWSPGDSLSQLDGSIDLAGLDRSTTGTGSRSTPGEKDCASIFDAEMSALEAEVSALEEQWARDGILMNATTFCTSAFSEISSTVST